MSVGIVLFLIFLIFAILMYLNKLPALLALPIMAILLIAIAGFPYYFFAHLLVRQDLLDLLTKGDPIVKKSIANVLIVTKGNFLASLTATSKDILNIVLAEGAIRLHKVIFVVLFGAILAQVISKSGIAETLIKSAAELAGDKPLSIGIILTFVIALLFTVLGGLGAVIMVATIVFPIMLSIGISPMLAGCLFLLGLSLGGTFNLANWQLYMDVLKLPQNTILIFATSLGVVFAIITLIFLILELKKSGTSVSWAVTVPDETQKRQRVSNLALLTPLIPVGLVFGFSLYGFYLNFSTQPIADTLRNIPVVYHILKFIFFPFKILKMKGISPFDFPIIPALIIGIIYGILTTRKKGVSSIQTLTKATFEGISDVAPAVALMMGIGMLLSSVMSPPVASFTGPLLKAVIPAKSYSYIIFFALLAPLALYRGPFNLWGMGSGLVGIMLATKALPAPAIMAALMSVGMIQGVCDPTNTHNVWIANYLNLDIQKILRKTLLYMWLLSLLGLIIGAIRYF